MIRLSETLHKYGSGRLAFWCPGCERPHAINCGEARDGPVWSWNGDVEQPTFSPSVLVTCGRQVDPAFQPQPGDPPERCHSFVTSGRIQFLSDCAHGLAGQTVDLPAFPKGDA